MIRTIIFWLILLVSSDAFAQSNPFKDAEIPIEALHWIRYQSRYSEPSFKFLAAIYGNIKYPTVARKMGAIAVLRVDYTVLNNGEVRIDTIMHIEEKQLPDFSDRFELIIIRNYLVPFVDSNGRRTYKRETPLRHGFAQRILRKTYGRILIEREVHRVFSILPRHQPATFCGSPINWSYTRYLKFMLE